MMKNYQDDFRMPEMPSNVRMTNIILFLDAEYHLILGCLILSNFRMPNAFKMELYLHSKSEL
jgi:hypothetical protein